MTLFRLSGVFLAVLLISACDKEPPTPPKAPTPAPPSVSAPAQPAPVAEPVKPEPAKAEAAAPVSKPAAKPAPAPKTVTQKAPEPKVQAAKAASVAPAKAEEPAKTVVRPPQPPDKIQRLQVNKPQTAEQRKASEAVKHHKLDKPKLDLHLPKDLVNKLEPQVAGAASTTPAAAPTLLPPMFAEKPQQQSSFEMGGRLITNERSRDLEKDASYWDTVDGAELQFKFNH